MMYVCMVYVCAVCLWVCGLWLWPQYTVRVPYSIVLVRVPYRLSPPVFMCVFDNIVLAKSALMPSPSWAWAPAHGWRALNNQRRNWNLVLLLTFTRPKENC
jgi:hypothetical protein